MVSLDPTSGHEQRGIRPVLILSAEGFNRLTSCPVIAPITNGGDFARRAGFSVSLAGAGTRTTGVVRCDQLRVLDVLSRGGRRVELVPGEVMVEVLARIDAIFA